MNDKEKLERLKNDPLFINEFYKDSKKIALLSLKKVALNLEDSKDAFQEVISEFYQRVKNGELDEKFNSEQENHIQNYINKACRNKIMDEYRRVGLLRDTFNPFPNNQIVQEDDGQEKEQNLCSVDKAMLFLKEKNRQCWVLIIKKYYEKCRMDEIAKNLDLANAATAKSKAWKCKNKLREIMTSIK